MAKCCTDHRRIATSLSEPLLASLRGYRSVRTKSNNHQHLITRSPPLLLPPAPRQLPQTVTRRCGGEGKRREGALGHRSDTPGNKVSGEVEVTNHRVTCLVFAFIGCRPSHPGVSVPFLYERAINPCTASPLPVSSLLIWPHRSSSYCCCPTCTSQSVPITTLGLAIYASSPTLMSLIHSRPTDPLSSSSSPLQNPPRLTPTTP